MNFFDKSISTPAAAKPAGGERRGVRGVEVGGADDPEAAVREVRRNRIRFNRTPDEDDGD
ncbi:hypothetical protein DERP_012712 [Dermatophagoides pteronyssinus]|uniref:Uncharacterized protein n=1 Tax=Dermatophagoides pteronyssinus TaxID=6956 RepID=A0ABQ8JQP9_DERPT|nr:hypothetical protein DERP_012712 [Dermatophagoides pteronyssinus]